MVQNLCAWIAAGDRGFNDIYLIQGHALLPNRRFAAIGVS